MGCKGGPAGEVGPGAREEGSWPALGQGHFPQPHLGPTVDVFYSTDLGPREAPPQGGSWPVLKQEECL